ncbi:MAG TPA: hypothetical protein VGJ09_09805 [Bryobacteraceae bacterium]
MDLNEMIHASTAVVRAKVVSSRGGLRGADIYTYYQIQVEENWKSSIPLQAEIAVPGGVAGGLRQMVAGAPALNPGEEYVLFLWTSRSGLTQVIGLSQGLFKVGQNSTGVLVVTRPAAAEMMLDKSGNVVSDSAVVMTLANLRTAVQNGSLGGK